MGRCALRAPLRPSAEWRPLCGRFFERPKAEALGYPEARTTAKSKRRDARVPRRCSGQAFPLRAGQSHRPAQWRDDVVGVADAKTDNSKDRSRSLRDDKQKNKQRQRQTAKAKTKTKTKARAKATSKAKTKARAGRVKGYIPTHRDGTAMDGAPARFGLVGNSRSNGRTTATTTATATATATAGPSTCAALRSG